MVSDYRLSQPLVVRMMGACLAVLGVLVFLVTAAVGLFSLPVAVLTVAVVLAVVLVFVLGFVLTRRLSVVRLAAEGYQVRMVRGTGVRQARWTDVEDVVARESAGERYVVIRLRDGGTTTIPVRVLAGSSEAFVRDLQQHLNDGHGYRRIT